MATQPEQTPDPLQPPQGQGPSDEDLLKQKYKSPRDLLLDPNFHSIKNAEVRRKLLGMIYPDFNNYDTPSQNDALGKKVTDWQKYYSDLDAAAKPKTPAISDKAISALAGGLPPPPGTVPFKPKSTAGIPGALPPEGTPLESIWDKADTYAKKFGIDPQINRAIILAESGGDPNTSRTDSNGLLSRGLYQWNGAGRGKGVPDNLAFDPDYVIPKSLEYIKPVYDDGVAQGLSGQDLLLYIGRNAQRYQQNVGDRSYSNAWETIQTGQELPQRIVTATKTAQAPGTTAAVPSLPAPPSAGGRAAGPMLPPPPGAGVRATGIAAPVAAEPAAGARAAGIAAPTPAQTQRPVPAAPTPFDQITTQIANQRKALEDHLQEGKNKIDALKKEVETPPAADAPFQEREDWQHKQGVLSDMVDSYNADQEQRIAAFNKMIADAQPQFTKAPAKYATPKKISSDTIRAVYDFFQPGLVDKMAGFYDLHPALRPFAQGLAEGTTLGFAGRQQGMPEPTGAYAKSMEWVGEQAGSLPYYYLGARLLGLAGGLLPKLPIVGRYLGILAKLPEAVGVRTAAAKTAEEAAEIASKMVAAGKTIEAPAALADALRIASENPNLTKFLTVPLIKAANVGTVMASVGAIHAIANGDDPKIAALHGYELALAGEMIAASPPMRALVDKLRMNIKDPSVQAMLQKIGIPKAAFKDYVDQAGEAFKEQPEVKRLVDEGEVQYAEELKRHTEAGTLHELPEKDDFVWKYINQNLPEGTSAGGFITNFTRGKIANEHPEYEVLRTFLNNYLTQRHAAALGEAAAGATSYGLAAAGIQIAYTPGDIMTRLKAGGRDGLSTFLAVGAFHLPSLIDALQIRAGRDLDPTEAATEYNNMTTAERKLLVGKIAQPDIDRAVENINNEAGQTPATTEPNPIPPEVGATPIEPTPAPAPPAEVPTPPLPRPPTTEVTAPPETPEAVPGPITGIAPGGTVDKTPPPGGEAQQPGRSEELVRGSISTDLNQNGMRETADNAEGMAQKPLSPGVQLMGIFSSDWSRAIQTAQIYSDRLGIPILAQTKGLQAWHLGPFEGQKTTDVIDEIHNYVRNPDRKIDGRSLDSTEDGESFNEFKNRGLQFFQDILQRAIHNPDGAYFLVTHYRYIKLLQSFISAGANGQTLETDPTEMERKDGDPGAVYHIAITPNGLQMRRIDPKADDPLQSGIYIIRHGTTDYNEGKPVAPAIGTPGAIEQPTYPETLETIGAQVQALGYGGRKVVFVPNETLNSWMTGADPDQLTAKLQEMADPQVYGALILPGKGLYIYRKDMISGDDIQSAVDEGRDQDLMGIVQPKSESTTIGVRAEVWDDPNQRWIEAATAVVSPENLAEQVEKFRQQFVGAGYTGSKLRIRTGPAEAIAAGTIEKRGGPEGLAPPPEPTENLPENIWQMTRQEFIDSGLSQQPSGNPPVNGVVNDFRDKWQQVANANLADLPAFPGETAIVARMGKLWNDLQSYPWLLDRKLTSPDYLDRTKAELLRTLDQWSAAIPEEYASPEIVTSIGKLMDLATSLASEYERLATEGDMWVDPHRHAVEQALRQGLQVPDKVMVDYPDLQHLVNGPPEKAPAPETELQPIEPLEPSPPTFPSTHVPYAAHVELQTLGYTPAETYMMTPAQAQMRVKSKIPREGSNPIVGTRYTVHENSDGLFEIYTPRGLRERGSLAYKSAQDARLAADVSTSKFYNLIGKPEPAEEKPVIPPIETTAPPGELTQPPETPVHPEESLTAPPTEGLTQPPVGEPAIGPPEKPPEEAVAPKKTRAETIAETLKGENLEAEAKAKSIFKKGRPPGSITLTQNDWAKAYDAAQVEDNIEPRMAMDLRKTKEGAYYAVPVMSRRASLIFGKKMYEDKPIDEVALRELLQNAIDAVRGLKDAKGAKITVDISGWNSEMIVTDTGVGMSTQTLGSSFVDPFSSLKIDENGDIIQNASGGFGVAKVAIYGAAGDIKVETVHYSRGHWTKTTLAGRGEDWASEKGFPVDIEKDTPSRTRGTRVQLQLKEGIRDWAMEKWSKRFLSTMRLPFDIEIKVAGRKIAPEPISWKHLDTLDTPSSSIDIYLDESPEKTMTEMPTTVMVEGMPMFEKDFWIGESVMLPPGMAIDVHPKGDPAHETIPYPLTLERNNLSTATERAVQDWMGKRLISVASEREIERNRNIVYNGTPIAGTEDLFVVDSNKSPLDPVLVHAVAYDPYIAKVVEAIAKVFKQSVAIIGEDHPDLANYVKRGRFMGIGLGGAYNGVTIQGDLKAGWQHEPDMPYIMLVNPFRIFEGFIERVEDTKGTDEAIQQFAIDLFATMIKHEPLHTKFWNHDDKYAGALTHVDTPRLQRIESRFGEALYYTLAEDGYVGWQHIKDLARPIIASWSREDLLSKISSLHGAGVEPGLDQIHAAVDRERGAEPGEDVPREIGDKTEGPPASPAVELGQARSIGELPDEYLDALLVVGSAAYRDTRDFDTWCAKVIQETDAWVQPFLNQVYGLIEEVAYANGLAEPPKPEEPPALPPPPESLKPPALPERDMEAKYQDLIDRVKGILANGESFNNPKLQALANEVFGGERGQGAYTLRDMYDAFEAGVSAYIEEGGIVDFMNPTATMDKLAGLQQRLAVQADRTMEQLELQQFSTPPMQAFLTVAALGNPSGVLKSLEPSAGTGMIATMLRILRTQVRVNEIDGRRAAILKLRGFLTTTVDALHLTATGHDLSDYVPDAIAMNPPFSAGPGGTKDMLIGARHVMNALQKLAPGGRLVAIVGDPMGHGRVQKYQKWWDAVEKKYNVIADIGLAGKFYSKMGTTFPQRLIVIDKTGPTVSKDKMIYMGDGISPAEALEELSDIMGDDIYGRTTQPDRQPGQAPAPPTEGPAVGPAAPPTGTGPGELGGPGGLLRPPTAGGPKPDELEPVPTAGVGGPGPSLPGPPEPGRKGKPTPAGEPGPGEVLGGGPSPADNVLAEPADSGQITLTDEQRRELGDEESASYVQWLPRKAIYKGIVTLAGEKGGLVVSATPHPGNLIESATLSSVEPPDVRKPLNLPDEVIYDPQIGKGRLSDAQLEAATYMVQSVNQNLPDGRNMGAWDGDGTGVGKGRQIAAVIYHFLRETGIKKAVWISVNAQLLQDAKRDIEAVGVPLPVLHLNDSKYDKGATIADKAGVLFTQYGTAAEDWNGKRVRFNQMNEWLGPDYEGVIVFDECHKLKNAIGTNQGGANTNAQGSQRGEMGLLLSQTYPKAKFLYVSATGATLAHNMAYMDRLGLWGPGAPFADFMSFYNAMIAGGLGSMEMLARDLKAVGSLVARQLSYKGVEYGFVDHTLNEYQVEQYNKSGELWSELIKAMGEAEENANQKRGAGRYSQFYSTQQRFFLMLMTTYQMQSVMGDMDNSLKLGMAPVVNILSTNETLMVRSVAKLEAEGKTLEDLDLGPRQMLRSYIEKYFPLEEYEDVPDPNDPKKTIKQPTGQINQENLRMQEDLLAKLEYLNLPDNPIDMIANHLGGWDRVAEVSGRQQRIENGKMVRIKTPGRQPNEQRNNAELRRFQNGQADVLIITGAGNAGISAQAEIGLPTENKRRVGYSAQLSWSADEQMQYFGRFHRSNEMSAPIIKLVRTNVKGQQRLTNAVSRRLAGLGAMTQGNRESLGGNLFDIEDLTDGYGRAALMALAQELLSQRLDPAGANGLTVLETMGWLTEHGNLKPNVDTNVDNFLNRILVLPVNIQNAVFEAFYDRRAQNVAHAKEEGTFDVGVTKIRGTDIVINNREQLHIDPRSNTKTDLISMEGSFHNPRTEYAQINSKAIDFTGFFTNTRSKRIYAVSLKIDPLTGARSYQLVSPHSTMQNIAPKELDENFLREDIRPTDPGFKKRMQQLSEPTKEELKRSEEVNQQALMQAEGGISLEELPRPPMYGPERAEYLWNKEYDSIPETVRKPVYMITGAIFPIYDRIVGDNGLHQVKVVRAKLKDGSGVIGLQVKANEIASLKSRMGLGNALAKENGQSIYHMVRDGATLEFDNGWRIYMSTPIHGERRMEINTQRAYKESIATQMKNYGAIVEVIVSGDSRRPRIFVPLDDAEGPKVLDKILERNKVVRVISTGEKAPGGLTPPPGPPGSASSMNLQATPSGQRTIDIGKGEPPKTIEEAVSAADFWIKQAQMASAKIQQGQGTEVEQRDIHQAPVIAQHLLNWIENQDRDQWDGERDSVNQVINEARNSAITSELYNPLVARTEADHYAPHVDRMAQDLKGLMPVPGLPPLEPAPGELEMSSVPGLPPPPTAGGAPTLILPPPPTSATFNSTAPPAFSKKDLVRRNEILATISRKLKVPIRYARFRQRALGIFKIDPNEVRIKMAQDINVAAHEIGHAINKILWGTSQKDLNWSPLIPFSGELNPIATKPAKGQPRLPEGFAEFVRMWITDPQHAEGVAPHFFNFFATILDGHLDLKDILTTAQTDYGRWLALPASAKVLSNIMEQPPSYETDWWLKIYTGVFDQIAPIEKAVRSITTGAGIATLPTEKDPYQLGRLMAGWVGKADHYLRYGTFDANTLEITGPSLQSILEPMKDRLDDLRITAVALRTLEKLGIQGKETGITIADAQESLREQGFDPNQLKTVRMPPTPGHEEMIVMDPTSLVALTPEAEITKQTIEQLYQFQRELFRYLRTSGLISPEVYAYSRLMNAFYVPFHRLYEAGAGEPGSQAQPSSSGGRSIGNLWQPVKRFKGSWRPIEDPLSSIVKNVYTFLNLGERNRIAQSLAVLAAEKNSAPWIVGPLPTDMHPTTFAIDRIKKFLSASGIDVTNTSIDWDQLATIFIAGAVPKAKENTITVHFDGKPRLFQLQPDLYKAVMALDRAAIGPVVKILSLPANLLRLGATGINPEFAFRNIPRDTGAAFMQTNVGFVPGYHTVIGAFHVLGHTDLYQEWLRSGAVHAALATMDRDYLKRMLKELLQNPIRTWVSHPLQLMKMASEVSEEMTRVGVYLAARKSGMTIRGAGLESREGSLDFHRMGAWLQSLNMMIPFFNANVQDGDKFFRTHKKYPYQTMVKAAVMATISLLVYYLNKDNEKYHELPWWFRDTFWCLPTDVVPWLRDLTPFIPIPKPFWWGAVYCNPVERIAEFVNRHDGSSFDRMVQDFVQNAMPGMIPQAIKIPFELVANYNTFTGRPIETQWMQTNLPAEYRSEWYTSEFAKKTALAFAQVGIHVSPVKIEHALFSTAGGTGRTVMKVVIDPAVKLLSPPGGGDIPAPRLIDLPLVRAFAARYPSGSLRSITDFEDMWNDLETKYRGWMESIRTPGRYSIPPLTDKELANLAYCRASATVISAYSNEIRRVTDDQLLSGDQKRRMIDEMYIEILMAARTALGAVKGKEQTQEQEDKLRKDLRWPSEPGLQAPPSR